MHIKLDWFDLVFKFSSEALLILLAVLTAAYNLSFFHFEFRDKSLSAQLLNNHPQLNSKLYEKNTSIITTVNKEAGIFTYAQAESFESLSNSYIEPQDTELSQPQDLDSLNSMPADSLQNLLDKQIKLYTVKEGDSLSKIAQANGINAQTIIWANNLPGFSVKPGWNLVILPIDGVFHKATSNDTLPDLAKKYKADLDKIIAYNGLASAEDIDEGQLIIVPGGRMPEAVKPKTIPKTNDGKVKPGGVLKPQYVDNGTGHIFPWGYCTWYVATKRHVPWGGNAKNWLANSKAYGSVISDRATVGAIVVTTDDRRFGHVAFVESVSDNGFVVSEMNYKKFGTVNTRFIPHGSKIIRGFILP